LLKELRSKHWREIGVISIRIPGTEPLLIHIHCAIPAADCLRSQRWLLLAIPSSPVKVLSRVFRGKFLAGLKRFIDGSNCVRRPPASWLIRSSSASFCAVASAGLGGLRKRPWRPKVLRYLRYTHRIAIHIAS